jgi:hypothetical protein
MKLGTVLTTIAAATLVAAQPALAATRSASSLPAAGAKISSVEGRSGSRIGQSEELAGFGALWIVALVGALAFLVLVVADEDSFDDVDDLPASP